MYLIITDSCRADHTCYNGHISSFFYISTSLHVEVELMISDEFSCLVFLIWFSYSDVLIFKLLTPPLCHYTEGQQEYELTLLPVDPLYALLPYNGSSRFAATLSVFNLYM